MSAYTSYTLTEEQSWQLDGVKGSLAIANRDATGIVVTCRIDKLAGMSETVVLVSQGDSLTANTEPYRAVTISASAYPVDILLLIAPAHDLTLTSIAAAIAGGINLAANQVAAPNRFHADAMIVTATTTTLYTPPTGMRAVVDHVLISTDTAMRVMVADGADVAGQRIAGGFFVGGGGLISEGEYVSAAADNPVVVITGVGSSNTFVQIDGFFTP